MLRWLAWLIKWIELELIYIIFISMSWHDLNQNRRREEGAGSGKCITLLVFNFTCSKVVQFKKVMVMNLPLLVPPIGYFDASIIGLFLNWMGLDILVLILGWTWTNIDSYQIMPTSTYNSQTCFACGYFERTDHNSKREEWKLFTLIY